MTSRKKIDSHYQVAKYVPPSKRQVPDGMGYREALLREWKAEKYLEDVIEKKKENMK